MNKEQILTSLQNELVKYENTELVEVTFTNDRDAYVIIFDDKSYPELNLKLSSFIYNHNLRERVNYGLHPAFTTNAEGVDKVVIYSLSRKSWESETYLLGTPFKVNRYEYLIGERKETKELYGDKLDYFNANQYRSLLHRLPFCFSNTDIEKNLHIVFKELDTSLKKDSSILEMYSHIFSKADNHFEEQYKDSTLRKKVDWV
ncbi:hypothetical protein JOC85_003083 [Bacillus mesophilus]|uniref:Uncharacterized protein n=1 Tax=Bacillus mesophilus TaxID=1808955 RepID=A0A6M0QBF3_9BACI|nr:hypothetical protein [Bacillus mesophilus]MBM7662276.1 hypothetical protein [Bacillus mesophilus]NEY73089.1 hypothetical protein [Bacillus mesophilus]